jgi:hypothetical protein
LQKFTKNLRLSAIVATLIGLSAPTLMAAQNWDDHDRSDRFFSTDSAVNYLESCAPNAILFTGGDNDTFPLWYAQEVEGVRTDMRVIVLSYYNTDWYIGQTMRQAYESAPLPYTLSIDNYKQGGLNDYLMYYETGLKNIDLKQYLALLKKNYKGLVHPDYGSTNMVPSKEIILPVDVKKVKAQGIIPKSFDSLIVPAMRLRMRSNGLEKKDLALLDLLATNNWERPLYVNNTSLAQFNVDLSPYVVQEGNAYRILPIQNPNPRVELVNTETCLKNMTTKFRFRGLQDAGVYYSPDYHNFILNHRSSFNSLAQALVLENKKDQAREALLFSLDKMPDKTIAYDYTSAQTVELLFEVGEKEKALSIANTVWPRMDEMASYLIKKQEIGRELQISLVILNELQRILYQYGEEELAKKIEDSYTKHSSGLGGGKGF